MHCLIFKVLFAPALLRALDYITTSISLCQAFFSTFFKKFFLFAFLTFFCLFLPIYCATLPYSIVFLFVSFLLFLYLYIIYTLYMYAVYLYLYIFYRYVGICPTLTLIPYLVILSVV